MDRQASRPPTDVHVITDASIGTTEDIDRRQQRYMITMAIRTICFILLIVVPSPWRWSFLFFAAVLPGIAVVLGNNTDRRTQRATTTPHEDEPHATAGALTAHQVIVGEADEAYVSATATSTSGTRSSSAAATSGTSATSPEGGWSGARG